MMVISVVVHPVSKKSLRDCCWKGLDWQCMAQSLLEHWWVWIFKYINSLSKLPWSEFTLYESVFSLANYVMQMPISFNERSEDSWGKNSSSRTSRETADNTQHFGCYQEKSLCRCNGFLLNRLCTFLSRTHNLALTRQKSICENWKVYLYCSIYYLRRYTIKE